MHSVETTSVGETTKGTTDFRQGKPRVTFLAQPRYEWTGQYKLLKDYGSQDSTRVILTRGPPMVCRSGPTPARGHGD